MHTRVLTLCDGEITIEFDDEGIACNISSKLHETVADEDANDPEEVLGVEFYNSMIDGIESLILACACEGIDVVSTEFQSAVQTALQACANNS